MSAERHADAILRAANVRQLAPSRYPAILAAVTAAMDEARAEERAKVVEWLREQADEISPDDMDAAEARDDPMITVMAYTHGFAACIERGEHLPRNPEGDEA